MALPRILALDAGGAAAYWERLGASGIRYRYGTHPRHGALEHQYGTAVDIAPELGAHLAGAVRAMDALIKGYIREAGGLTPWLRSRASTRFGGGAALLRVGEPAPGAPALRPGPGAPDAVALRPRPDRHHAGRQRPRRSGVGRDPGPGSGTPACRCSSSGPGWRLLIPAAPTSWAGSAPPLEALSAVHRVFGEGDDDVSVLGTFPSTTGNLPDEAGWAMVFSPSGLPRGFFLATDLERDAEGWYHLEHERDPATGNPVLDAEDRPVRRSPLPRKRRIRHVVTMQTRARARRHPRSPHAPRARERFLEFLADGETVKWIFPHAAWYIADKSLMARIHADLLAAGSPYADLFVACHGPGEIVAAHLDRAMQKPIYVASGAGSSPTSWSRRAPRPVVPEGFVAQARFSPFPLPLRLSEGFASGFPVPEGAPGAAEHRADPCFTTATVELRIMSMPGSTEARDAYLFMARVAPTWDPGDPAPTAPVLTNLAKIQAAMWSSPSVRADNHQRLPFGWCAVTLGADEP